VAGDRGRRDAHEHIVIAIFVIGIVGLILETLLVALARRFTYTEE
jgi:nitrate/nitrite transport system permease protein